VETPCKHMMTKQFTAFMCLYWIIINLPFKQVFLFSDYALVSILYAMVYTFKLILFSFLAGTPGDWSHIIKQIGMFTFTGLNTEQVAFMTKEYHIYMTSDG
jgi:hypothetical protein